MSLFICAKCGCVENTALSHFWLLTTSYKSIEYDPYLIQYKGKGLCTECATIDKDTGKIVPGGIWHGKFKKEKATREQLSKASKTGLINE